MTALPNHRTSAPLIWNITGLRAAGTAVAVYLRVFGRADHGQRVSATEFASASGIAARSADLPLTACAVFGLSETRDTERHRNMVLAATYLIEGKPQYFGGLVPACEFTRNKIRHVDLADRIGIPERDGTTNATLTSLNMLSEARAQKYASNPIRVVAEPSQVRRHTHRPFPGSSDGVSDVLRAIEHPACLLLPLFFTISGLAFEIDAVDSRGLILLMLLGIAVIAKVGRAYAVGRLTGLAAHASAHIAVLVNTSGLAEMVALNVALSQGVIGRPLFTVFALIALLTTAMTGPLLWVLDQRTPSHSVAPAVLNSA